MPAVTVKNILVGAGHLYVSKTDATAAAPTAPTDLPGPPAVKQSYSVALDGVASEYRYMGATSGGLSVSYTPDTTDIEVDQLKDAALVFNSGQTMTVSTTLAEATLANLMVAWGFRSTDLVNTGTTLNLPAAPDGLVERSICVLGNAPATTTRAERLYYGRRCVNVEGSETSMSRTDLQGVPITFRLLPDPASTGAEYGQVIDRAIG
jgi:hypothetical protein